MILDPSHPSLKPPSSDTATRPLAYEQAIAHPPKPAAEDKKKDATETEIPPFQTVTTQSAPEDSATDGTADQSAVPSLPADGADAAQDMASLPEDVTPHGTPSQDAAPGQPAPYGDTPPVTDEAGQQGAGQGGPDGAGQLGDQRDQGDEPWSYGDAYRQDNGGDQDGNGYQERNGYPDANGDQAGNGYQEGNGYPDGKGDQAGNRNATEWADQNTEEWVQVIISGASMRATAADDAPMLFAFPYGRNLKVVSRYEGWVEVTDPQSAATGWMKAGELAPSAAPRPDGQAYYDPPPPRQRGGLFRRGGFADMISRALGGGF